MLCQLRVGDVNLHVKLHLKDPEVAKAENTGHGRKVCFGFVISSSTPELDALTSNDWNVDEKSRDTPNGAKRQKIISYAEL